MFTDPVFFTLAEYKKSIEPSDVIRFELIIRAEIARIDQYIKHAYTLTNKKDFQDIRQERIDNLKQTLAICPMYLELCFKEHLKTVPFWSRNSVKATSTSWKYTFYQSERLAGMNELTVLLKNAAKTTIKDVKDMKEAKGSGD